MSALESGAIAGRGVGNSIRRHCHGIAWLGDTTEVISNYQFNNVNVNPAWSEKNRASVVRFLKAHIQALRWIHDSPSDAVEFMTREFGLQTTYARRGIEYYIKNKIYPVNGDVTLSGLKVNIEVQAQDGIKKAHCRRRRNI